MAATRSTITCSPGTGPCAVEMRKFVSTYHSSQLMVFPQHCGQLIHFDISPRLARNCAQLRKLASAVRPRTTGRRGSNSGIQTSPGQDVPGIVGASSVSGSDDSRSLATAVLNSSVSQCKHALRPLLPCSLSLRSILILPVSLEPTMICSRLVMIR